MHSCLSCCRTFLCVHHDGAQGVGTDTRLDITSAQAIFHSEILAPLVQERGGREEVRQRAQSGATGASHHDCRCALLVVHRGKGGARQPCR